MTEQTPDTPEPNPAAQSGPLEGLPSGRWTVDPAHSRAEFAVKHFWGLITVRGKLTELAGELAVDPSGGIDGSLRIKAASVDTGNRQRDKHLRSADFFGSDEHPEVVFTPSAVRKAGDSGYRMDGTLAIAGASLEFQSGNAVQDPDSAAARGFALGERRRAGPHTRNLGRRGVTSPCATIGAIAPGNGPPRPTGYPSPASGFPAWVWQGLR